MPPKGGPAHAGSHLRYVAKAIGTCARAIGQQPNVPRRARKSAALVRVLGRENSGADLGRILPRAGGVDVATLHAAPTLDELASDPSKAQGLPAELAAALQTKCLLVLNALWTRQLAARPEPAAAQSADALLDVQDAAQRLKTSTDWLYRHARRLPFTVRNGRQLRFSAAGIARYIRERQGA